MLPVGRAQEVRRWLRVRVTLDQAEVRYADLERATIQVTGAAGGWLDYFRERIVAELRPGDELWLYDTGAEAWEELRGEQGLAVVRGGEVVELLVERES